MEEQGDITTYRDGHALALPKTDLTLISMKKTPPFQHSPEPNVHQGLAGPPRLRTKLPDSGVTMSPITYTFSPFDKKK